MLVPDDLIVRYMEVSCSSLHGNLEWGSLCSLAAYFLHVGFGRTESAFS